MRSTPLIQLLLITSLASTCAFSAEDKAVESGAKVFQDSCLDCHKGNQSIEQVRLTRDKWKEVVDRMIESGFLERVPSKDKLTLLLDYLAKTRGPADTTGSSKN